MSIGAFRTVVAGSALLGLAQTGCAFGFGSTFVGQWRAREDVRLTACLEDAAGRCIDNKQLVRQVPERSYWGFMWSPVAGIGAAYVKDRDGHSGTIRLETSAELLHGRGRYAVGFRSGITVDNAMGVPLLVVGHYSLTPRLAVHGGLGYIAFGATNTPHGTDFAYSGFRSLLGLQYALGRTRETYSTFNLEADTQWIGFDQPYRTSGLTTGFAFHF